MKKVRINTALRNQLGYYVRSEIETGIDQTPVEAVRGRLQAEALRMVAEAYPLADMVILASYGMTRRYDRFTFLMPKGETQHFEFPEPLPHDLPDSGGYRFEPSIEADAAFIAAAQAVTETETALQAETERQWKQARILVNCALYFEDVLDYLGIPDSERVSLAHRWSLPVPADEYEADEEGDQPQEEGESDGEAIAA